MEDDLTWLARNVHVWPKCTIDGEYRETLLWIEPSKGDVKAAFSSNPLHCFDRDQWLARRAELQNKPSWKDAPEWATHLAQDGGGFTKGTWNWYDCKPDQMTIADVWTSDVPASPASIGEVLGDWRDTLEWRPADMPALVVTERQEESTWFERGELPPIGIWCEASCEGAEPEKCKVIAYHKQQVAVQWSQFNHGCLDVLEMPGWAFRPIRTDREKAIEEMMGSVLAVMNRGLQRRLCEDLYDAGYRKQEDKA